MAKKMKQNGFSKNQKVRVIKPQPEPIKPIEVKPSNWLQDSIAAVQAQKIADAVNLQKIFFE